MDAGGSRQAGAEFGDAVAIDGNTAVVGAWKEDNFGKTDSGAVYTFDRTNSGWVLSTFSIGNIETNGKCGYSVAISAGRIVYGCPGENGNAGRAYVRDLSTLIKKELIPGFGDRNAGDFYGASVAISGDLIYVGEPLNDNSGLTNNGRIVGFTIRDSSLNYCAYSYVDNVAPHDNDQFGTSLAVDGVNTIIGVPNSVSGTGKAYFFPGNTLILTPLSASDGAAGDLFGQSVAISGNTAVVGAGFNDEKGTDAGAAYVFVRDANGQWSQQQKLTASDARAGDLFGYGAPGVAIQGNTIVVGALFQDGGSSNSNDNRGAAYIFTRNLTSWTQQTKINPTAFISAPGDLFGNSVSISGDAVTVGAQRAAADDGTLNTGAAYVYRLNCTPAYQSYALIGNDASTAHNAYTVCPGASVYLFVGGYEGAHGPSVTVQWRKNGATIPGETRGSFQIRSATASDAGSYDFIISNSCGSDISVPATLTVRTSSLNPTSQNFGVGGSTGIVNVTSTGSCGFLVTSNASWITISSGAVVSAPGTVGFTVAANTTANQRTGTITIGDKNFAVSQDGLNCSYSIAPTAPSFSAGSNASSVNVTATTGCAWTAISNDNWLTITSGSSGTGNGVANYSVAANTGPARTGTLTVAGQSVTVTQANGCTFVLSPTAQNFPSSVAAGAVNVTSSAGCAWTATSNASFISITSGASGTGTGTVNYSVTANTSSSTGSGTLSIAGQTFTVTQDGAAPTVQFSAASYSVGEGELHATLNVTSGHRQYQTEGETYETQLSQIPSHGSTALPVMGNRKLRTRLAADEDDHANRAGRRGAGQD